MDIVSIFSFVSMVSIVINVDIVIVVSTLCFENNIRLVLSIVNLTFLV